MMDGLMSSRLYHLDIIVGLLLLCLFTLSMLFTLSSGSGVYQKISGFLAEQYNENTCLAYIAQKVRHYDVAGGVEEQAWEGTQALVLHDTIAGDDYLTYIYYYNGYVRELFCQANSGLKPEDGERIIAVDGLFVNLTYTESGRPLLEVSCLNDGEEKTLMLTLRSEEYLTN